uniref:Uncharacterized protein n=1 Tax=Vespula pensylvanica TaxID=30213 RepID=A0A834N662_VESPE|nr:hypothetical protein H0235_016727 [Vespula pensylvanica]
MKLHLEEMLILSNEKFTARISCPILIEPLNDSNGPDYIICYVWRRLASSTISNESYKLHSAKVFVFKDVANALNRCRLIKQIECDTKFQQFLNLMDYSFIIEMDPIPSFPNFKITIVVRKNDIRLLDSVQE